MKNMFVPNVVMDQEVEAVAVLQQVKLVHPRVLAAKEAALQAYVEGDSVAMEASDHPD